MFFKKKTPNQKSSMSSLDKRVRKLMRLDAGERIRAIERELSELTEAGNVRYFIQLSLNRDYSVYLIMSRQR